MSLLTGNDFGASPSLGGGAGPATSALPAGSSVYGPGLPWKSEPPVAAAPEKPMSNGTAGTVSGSNGTPWNEANDARSDTRVITRAAASASKPLVVASNESISAASDEPAAPRAAAKVTPPKAIAGELAEEEGSTESDGKEIRITALSTSGPGTPIGESRGPVLRGPKTRAITKPAYKQPVVAKNFAGAPATPTAAPLTIARAPEPATVSTAPSGSDLSRFRQSAGKK